MLNVSLDLQFDRFQSFHRCTLVKYTVTLYRVYRRVKFIEKAVHWFFLLPFLIRTYYVAVDFVYILCLPH